MNLYILLGAVILSLPFIAMTAAMVWESGWGIALATWGVTLVLVGLITLGAYSLIYGIALLQVPA